MSVKIILSRTGEPAEKRELVIAEETFSIGREPSNAIALAGTQVSKAHARIERRGSEYYIVDLNSTNFTYLNGEKLAPGKPRPLHGGDRVSISDYDIQIFPQEAPAHAPETPAEHGDKERWTRTTGVPENQKRQVAVEMANRDVLERWSKLAGDIQKSLEAFDVMDIARRQEELQARCDALEDENRRLREDHTSLPGNGESRATPLPVISYPDEARSEQVMRVLLELFFKLSSGRSSFLSEFIIRTVVRTSRGLPVEPRSDEEVLRYFTDSRVSEGEFRERLELLKKEADQIVLHMMGLLEGYRRSVDDGARRILQRVDPDRLGEELPDTIPMRYLPPLADLKLFQLVRIRLRDLLQEDRGVLEKQLFRPGFVRAYEECVETAIKV